MSSRRRDRGAYRTWAWALSTACAAGVASIPRLGQAQTWTAPTDGVWSNPVNWTTPPVAGPTTVLTFAPSPAQTFVSTDDMPGPFALNVLVLGGSSSGSITVATGSLSTLRFEGAGESIQVSQPGPVFLNGRIRQTSDLALSLGAGAGTFTVGAALSGTGNLIISNGSSSAIVLAAANSYTGTTSLVSGRLELGHQDAIGGGTLTASGGLLATTIDVVPSGSPPQRPIFTNAITSIGSGLSLGGNLGFTLGGVIDGSAGVTFSPTNVLDGTWALSGANTFNGPVTVNGSAAPGVTSSLLFATPAALGNAPTININGGGARVLLGGTSAPVTFTQPVNLGTLGGQIGAFSNSVLPRVTLSGNITGSGTLISSGGGILSLTGTNTFTGPLVLASGITSVQADANLGNSTISLAGGSLLLDAPFTTTSRAINVSAPGSTIYALGSVTLGGTISNSVSSSYAIGGPGTLVMTGSNSFSNLLTINNGTVLVSGASGKINNGGSIIVNEGAALVIDNSSATPTRIASNSRVTLNGGDFRFVANGTTSGTLDINNANLNIGNSNNSGAGLAVVTLDSANTSKWRVRFDGLPRTLNNGTMLRIVGNQVGQAPIATGTNNLNLIFDNAPTLQPATTGILPWAIVDTLDGNVDFVTYDATNGARRFTGYAADFSGGINSTASVSSIVTAAGTTSINAVKATGGTIDLTAGTLALQAGGVLVTGASTFTGGTLLMGTGSSSTGIFHTDADLTITSRILTIDGGGLVSGISKAGPGVLTIAPGGGTFNTYVGPTFIHSGTLRIGNAFALPPNSEVFVGPGATLDLNGVNATVGAINMTGPLSTVVNQPVGTVNIGAATLTAGGGTIVSGTSDNLSTTVNLNFVGTGGFVKTGNGTMTVVGSQAFTGVVSIANGALVLGTHQLNGTGFSNASTINLGTGAGTADVTLGFDYGLRDGFAVPIIVNVASTGFNRAATLKFLSGPQGSPGVVFNSNIINNGTVGLTIDSSAGSTIAGTISNGSAVMSLNTISSDGVLTGGPDGFAINITGNNNYTGTTTLAAISTLFGHANAFGTGSSAINLGSTGGDDQPEMSSSVGGLVLTRNIIVNNSTSATPSTAYIGSRAPAGSGTTTYSGTINIAGSRKRLVLFSDSEPVVFTNTISGFGAGTPALATFVQIGRSYGPGLETTRSNVTLSGANTFPGGVQLVTGSLNIGNNAALGPGSFTIGTAETPIGSGPTISAAAAPRTITNSVIVNSNFNVVGPNQLTLSGPVDLGNAPRVINVDASSRLDLNGLISGTAGTALVKEGNGTLVLGAANNPYAGPTVGGEGRLIFNATQHLGGLLAVTNGATVQLSAGGAKVLVTPALSIDSAASGGHLDLTDNDMIVDYTGPAGSLVTDTRQNLRAARLFSSVATATTRLGYLDNADLATPKTTFSGQSVDPTSLLVKYTYAGDSDLDGDADGVDIGAWALNFTGELGSGPSATKVWSQGDWDYDGDVDGVDAGLWATAFTGELGGGGLGSIVVNAPSLSPQAASILQDLGITVVPEPASLGLTICSIAMCVTYRRARQTRV